MTAKPNPRRTPINAPFWEGCNDGRLMLQRCAGEDCERYVYYPRACCPHCGRGDLDWVQASGRGRVVSWTLVHRPHHAGFGPAAPYVFVAVELAEGPLMYSRLAGTASEDLIGRNVRAVFVEHGPDQMVPFFEIEDGRDTVTPNIRMHSSTCHPADEHGGEHVQNDT